jgi:hypothetical protein
MGERMERLRRDIMPDFARNDHQHRRASELDDIGSRTGTYGLDCRAYRFWVGFRINSFRPKRKRCGHFASEHTGACEQFRIGSAVDRSLDLGGTSIKAGIIDRRGEAGAQRAYDALSGYLAEGIANIFTLFDPQAVLLCS